MLSLQRRPGETIRIGDDIALTVLSVQGMHVRLGVLAPREMDVDRQEVRERKDAGLPPPNGRPRLSLRSAPHSIPIDGAAMASAERLHYELAAKLGFPEYYGRNWDALLDCLSSIDDPDNCLCAAWTFRSPRLVIEVRNFSHDVADSDVNACLDEGGQGIRIGLEYVAL